MCCHPPSPIYCALHKKPCVLRKRKYLADKLQIVITQFPCYINDYFYGKNSTTHKQNPFPVIDKVGSRLTKRNIKQQRAINVLNNLLSWPSEMSIILLHSQIINLFKLLTLSTNSDCLQNSGLMDTFYPLLVFPFTMLPSHNYSSTVKTSLTIL